MALIDIAADLNSEDETGLVWTFLDQSRDSSIIRPGEVVVGGSELTPAVCDVVDLVEKPAGMVVHRPLVPSGTGPLLPPSSFLVDRDGEWVPELQLSVIGQRRCVSDAEGRRATTEGE